MTITLETYDSVNFWQNLGIQGVVELADGTAVSTEFVYCLFQEGNLLLDERYEIAWVVLDDWLFVTKHGVINKRQ